MSMPYALRRLREQSPTRYKEACRRGGKAAAKRRAKKDIEADLKQAAAEAIEAREEEALRRSTNEHILTADGEHL